jgi:T5SS/PEP-CTERM-associated repeat protein
MLNSRLPVGRRVRVGSVLRSAALCALAAALPAQSASATTWTGFFTNSWTFGGNWDTFAEPGPADAAQFIGGGTSVILDANRSVLEMTIPVAASSFTFSRSNSAVLNIIGSNGLAVQNTNTSFTTFSGFVVNTTRLLSSSNGRANFNAGTTIAASDSFVVQGTSISTMNASSISANFVNVFNTGQLVMNTGSTLTVNNNINVNNDATLTLNSGTINLLAGGSRTININGATARMNINTGFAVPAASTLAIAGGGDVVGTSYIDIGNGQVNTLTVNGAGSTYTTAGTTATDWGAGSSGSAAVTLSNSGQATTAGLRIGTSNGVAGVGLLSGSQLKVNNNLEVGGGTTTRFVGIDVTGSTLDVVGNTFLNNQADLNLNTGGTVIFRADARINPGGRMDQTGGTLNTTGISFTVAGGTFTRTTTGDLSNNSTFRVQDGGTATFSSYFDIANSNTTGTLVVTGAGSTYSAGGTSDWGSGLGRIATATISAGGVASLSTLRTAGSGATSTITLTGGESKLNVSENFTLGSSVSSGVANMTIGVGSRLNVGDTAASVVGPPNYSYIEDTSVNASAGGTLFVYGGSTLTNDGGLSVGTSAGRSGRVLVSGVNSVVNAGQTVYLGLFGKGIVDVEAGGSFRAGGIQVGGNSGSTGVVTVTGANSSLRASDNLFLGEDSGGTGTLTTTAGGTVIVGDNALGFASDRLVVADNNPPSADAGGKLSIFNGSVLNHHFRALIGGTANTYGTVIVRGTGSHFIVGDRLFVGNFGSGTLNIHNGGRASVNTYQINTSTGSKVILDFGGTFDIVSSPQMLTDTRSYLAIGYNGGDWLGTSGITSLGAQADSRFGIGYVDDGTLITLKLTLKGDTNLTGAVDFNDLLALAQNYNGTGKHWFEGDFDYNGLVNFNDLLSLAQNYNLSLSTTEFNTLLDAGGTDFGTDWTLARALVPEPTSLTLLLGAGTLLKRRRQS